MSSLNIVKRLNRTGLIGNAGALYSAHLGRVILPLLVVPYLARTLGPTSWGLLSFAQAFGQYFGLVTEYGFNLSATREVARQRQDRDQLSQILAGVMGAKVILFALGAGIVAIVGPLVPIFREEPLLLWVGFFAAGAQAFNMLWYFQGLEEMRLVATLDLVAQLISTVAIFIFVHTPEQGWYVLLFRGIAALISVIVGMMIILRRTPWSWPTWDGVRQQLRSGWSMFLFTGSVSLYTVGNAFLLGLFVAPEFVGYYVGAEKISKAFRGLLEPINRTLFPRFSRLLIDSPLRAAKLAQTSLWVMGLGGMALGAIVFFPAPFWVRLMLGPGYEPAIPALRILALLPPVIALSNMLGIQWMLPLNMESSFNKIVLTAGLINTVLAVLFARPYQHVGMAWAVVLTEIFVTGAVIAVLVRRRMDPFRFVQTISNTPIIEAEIREI